jgi:type I restriction enzyme S subunit
LSEKIIVGIASAATHAYRARGIVLIRNQNIKPGYLDDTDLLYIDPNYELTFKNKRLKKGDLLTARTGYPGTTCVVPDEYDSAQSFTTLITRPNPQEVDSLYLCYYVNSETGQKFFEQNQIGGGQKNVNAGSLKRMPIAFPSSMLEQKVIAATLADVDAQINSLDRLITKKRDIKQASMQQLLTGKTRLPGFQIKAGFKRTDAGLIPEDWTVRPLLKAVTLPTGQVDPRLSPYKSMILVAPDHVEGSTGKLLEKVTAEEQKAISGKFLFKPGDVVYSKIRPYLRKAILADFPGLCSADMYPMSAAVDISPGYLLAVILSHRFSVFADSVSARSGIPKINRTELAEFHVALPGLEEQKSIAALLSDMDLEIAALQQRHNKTILLKQALMQQLLTGRMRLI